MSRPSRHLINHHHTCPTCEEIHVFVIDMAPVLKDLTTIKTEARKTARAVGELMSELTDLRDNVAALFADFAAKIQRLQDSVDNPDNSETHLSEEDQAALDELKASVDAGRASVGDENGDGTPADTQPV